jgi:Tol biopolymer transport system component
VIVFRSTSLHDNGDIFVTSPDGTDVTPITSNTAGELCPTLSPDGYRIAFTGSDMFIMNVDRSSQVTISTPEAAGYLSCPAWSHDGKHIAFFKFDERAHTASPSPLYTVDADGSNKRIIYFGYNSFAVSWSPDDKQILFSSSKYGVTGPSDVVVNVMNADGTGLRTFPAAWYGAAWSPDGERIAYICGTSLNRSLCSANPDGTDITVLYNALSGMPQWSPNGRTILFKCVATLCRADAASGNVTQLGSGYSPQFDDADAAQRSMWSPAGDRIAFPCVIAGRTDICVMNADGSGLRTLSLSVSYPTAVDWSRLP